MKKLMAVFVVFAFLSAHQLNAQIQIVFPKRVESYKKALDTVAKDKEILFSGKTFDGVKYKNKKNGRVVTFSDLPEFEREILTLGAFESFETSLLLKQKEWSDELKNLKIVENEAMSLKDGDIANRTDVLHFKDKLKAVQIEAITQYQITATAFFTKYSDRFTKSESQVFLAKIAKTKQKLTEGK